MIFSLLIASEDSSFFLFLSIYHLLSAVFPFTCNFTWFIKLRASAGMCGVCAGVCGCVRCAQVCGMNFQNFFWRIESLHKRTLIRILYEFFCLYLLLVVERNSQKLEPHPNYKNFVLDCMPFLPRPKKAVLKSLIFSPILMTISHRGGHLEILSI